VLKAALHQVGLGACLISRLPVAEPLNWKEHIVANGWPPEWYHRYRGAGHYRHDPCVRRCRYSAEAFLWSDIWKDGLERPAQTVMQEAADFGLREGICVPLHAPFVPPCVVSLSGEAAVLPGDGVQMMTILAHLAWQSAMQFAAALCSPSQPVLTSREREILRWVGEGKTAWEISRILSLSEHTVLSHQRNARGKLNATNNVHAVVKSILRNEF
jgi:LuxR family transcriptional regulator, quorum-sensing system regulator BjaR1